MKKTKILIAQDARALAAITTALRDFDVTTVLDLKSAKSLVQTDLIDIFIIGIHFDDSHAVDLISYIRNETRHKNSPIVVVRLLPTAMSGSLRVACKNLIKARVISDYLELENDPHPDAKIRTIVQSVIISLAETETEKINGRSREQTHH